MAPALIVKIRGNQVVGSFTAADPPSARLAIVLSLRATGQGIVHAVVQAANCLVVISLLVDFEVGAQKTLRRKLFDCELDGVCRVPKSLVSDRSTPGFLPATGEQLRRGVIIEFDYDWFDRGVFGRHLFERDLFDHGFIFLFSFDVMAPVRVLVTPRQAESVVQADELRPLQAKVQVMPLLNALVTPDLSGSAI